MFITDPSNWSAFKRTRLIHIVDDDLDRCEALHMLFRFNGYQAAFSSDRSEFLNSLCRRQSQVVVMNLHLGGESTLPLLRRVKAIRAATPVLMIAETSQLTEVVEAMKLGATDVLSSPLDRDYLLQAVWGALRRTVQLGTIEGGGRSVEKSSFSELTPREREVLQLVVNGCSNKVAGLELNISPRTVEVHRARVMEKLGARNTAELMRIVLKG